MSELEPEIFDLIRRNAPLISIDLIIENSKGEILLGLRNNCPAEDSWFVPGGRLRKTETLNMAFARICETELPDVNTGVLPDWLPPCKDEAQFVGVYNHIYPATKERDFSIEYVVLAYRIQLAKWPTNLDALPIAPKPVSADPNPKRPQHREWGWWDKYHLEGTRSGAAVNGRVKAYSLQTQHGATKPLLSEGQYAILANRRMNLNSLLWQTPAISLTAEAFLFQIAFGSGYPIAKLCAFFLIAVVSGAAFQLLMKHRAMEEGDCVQLEAFERIHNLSPIHRKPAFEGEKDEVRKALIQLSSFKIWLGLLAIFFVIGSVGFCITISKALACF